MKVIIVGCGKLGSGLAKALEEKGDFVTIIDCNEEAFQLLDPDFKGKTIVGVGFDKDVLEKAEIQKADAIISCGKSDETNALVGRIARNIYQVPRVIARLYDPRRAKIYRSLGIQTISTTVWGVQRAKEMLNFDSRQLDNMLTIGDSDVEIVATAVPSLLVGRSVSELTVYGEMEVVSIKRHNKAFIPVSGTKFEQDDTLYIALMSSSAHTLKKYLGLD